MANLPESNEWTTGVYQLETSDPVLAGPEGIDNLQAKQLANRTKWLKSKIDGFLDGKLSVVNADKLSTARSISISGAATGSADFDGSDDADIEIVLKDSGVEAGEYTKFTVDKKGIITGAAALATEDLPDGTTAPKFNRSEGLATNEFVMRALGSFAGSRNISESLHLTAEEVGMRVELSADVVATLPITSSVPEGSVYLVSAGPLSTTSQVVVEAGDELAMNNLSVFVPYTLSPGGDVLFIREGNVWRGHCGTETLRTSKLFAAAFDGYGASQSLPSGFIIKAGHASTTVEGQVPVTFPVAFPNECIIVVANYGGASSAVGPSLCQHGLPTRTGFNGYLTNVVGNSGAVTIGGYAWIALGY